MAHYNPIEAFKFFTGALSKKKDTRRFCVTRIKSVKDPITGEVIGHGPKEIYLQEKRDYQYHPLTPAEQAQRLKWREACKAAAEIIKNKSHPRYMELYHLWRAHISTTEKPMQFPNFVRHVLSTEG